MTGHAAMPGVIAAIAVIARTTWRQTMRARTLWLSTALLAFPVALAPVAAARSSQPWQVVFELTIALLAVVPPLHLAPALADEIEDQTFTYLWSRPVPRYAIVLGKLAAVVPLLALGFALSAAAAFALVSTGGALPVETLVRAELAIVLGVVATSAISIGMGALIPRQSQAAAIAFLALVDLAVGTIPISMASLSVTRHVRLLADTAESRGLVAAFSGQTPAGESVLWILGIGALWLIATLWRVQNAQYAGKKSPG